MIRSLVRRLGCVAVLALSCCLGNPAVAADAPPERPVKAAAPSLAIPEATTGHVLRLGDQELAYNATAGTLPLRGDRQDILGQVFFVAYQLTGADKANRPIAFVFNGGPGAASAYLHLGALGPRRLALNDDGSLPPGPARVVDNPLTWLAFTDLVFIDPIGTGYSEAADNDKTSRDRLYGVRPDLRALGRIIELYLTRSDRWASPKYLVGESYGGFRAAALTDFLQTEFGITVQGAVLISPVLQFNLQEEEDYALAPWVVRLPTYAALARLHGKSASEGDAAAAQQAVEKFSLDKMLPELAEGDALPQADRQALYRRLADLTGLPGALVARHRGRIPVAVFAKELLRDSGQVLSLYDGSLSNVDPEPARAEMHGPDAELSKINAKLTAATVSYLHDELKVTTDRPYLVLNTEVARNWNWRSGRDGAHAPVGVASNLKAALSRNPELRVIIAQGYYDLVTPYFAAALVQRQMGLAPGLREHLMLKVYDGGHMLYSHGPAQRQLFEDAQALISGKPNAEKRG